MIEKKKTHENGSTIIVALVLIMFLFACDVISVHPITTIKKAYFTKNIVGIWINEKDNSDTISISIKKRPIYSYGDKDKELVTFYISKIKGNYYMNIVINDDLKIQSKNKIPKDINFAFMQLFYKNGKLGMADIDKTIVINAIKQGELKGIFSKKKDDMVEIQSDSKSIFKFFKKYKKMKKNIKIVWYKRQTKIKK